MIFYFIFIYIINTFDISEILLTLVCIMIFIFIISSLYYIHKKLVISFTITNFNNTYELILTLFFYLITSIMFICSNNILHKGILIEDCILSFTTSSVFLKEGS